MNMPTLLDEVQLLRMWMGQRGWIVATLAVDMTSFGWTWSEDLLNDILEGRKKPNAEQREFIRIYLLMSYKDMVFA